MKAVFLILFTLAAWQSTQTDLYNLKNPDQHIRWRAARGLRERGAVPGAGVAIPALIQVANEDPSIDVRLEAVLALGSIGMVFPKAVDSLVLLVNDKNNRMSHWAVIALGDSGPGAQNAVSSILKYLKSTSDSEQIFDSIETLGKIGPSARLAIPTIEKYLNNHKVAPERGEIGAAAQKAIQRIRQR
jgi:HEAT repeat protein